MIVDLIIFFTNLYLITKFKSNFVRLHLLLIIYPVFILLIYKSGYILPGIISVAGLAYYSEYISIGFYWLAFSYLLFVSILWAHRHKTIEFNIINIKESSRLIICLGTLISAAIFLPKAFFLSEQRFNLLPFFAWGGLYNIFSILLILSHTSFKKLSSVLHLILLLYIMFRGERADHIMVLGTLFLFKGASVKSEIQLSLKNVLTILSVVIITSIIGIARIDGFNNILDDLDYYIGMSLYAQQTGIDVVHVYMSSIWYYFNEKFNPLILLNLPLSIIPGLPGGGTDSVYNYSQFLKTYIPNVNGGLFYSEAILNFGLLGLIIYMLLFALIIRYCLLGNGLTWKIFMIIMYIMSFRFQWYGALFIIKPFILGLFFILFLKMYTKKILK